MFEYIVYWGHILRKPSSDGLSSTDMMDVIRVQISYATVEEGSS